MFCIKKTFFSVWAWELADSILFQNKDKEFSHFAATTLRNKIQKEFRELPEPSHFSLRDSLLKHIESFRQGQHILFYLITVFRLNL